MTTRTIREVSRKPRKASKRPSKRVSPNKLKKELDMVFSLFIRAKYPKVCYTCKATDKTLQCGHFITRNHLATRWLESNCRPQCLTSESSIKLSNGEYKTISEIKTGDSLAGFDEESFEPTNGYVIGVECFTPIKLYEVLLEDGSKFYATSDHRVVSNGEWVSVEDMLHNVTTHNIMEI